MTVPGRTALLLLAGAAGLGLFLGLAQSPALDRVSAPDRDANAAVVEIRLVEQK